MTWDQALDAFARTLLEQRAALDRGDVDDVVAFSPPSGLGPLPADLLPRARALVEESDQHVRLVRSMLASTQRELDLLQRMQPAGASPSYVDQAM